MPSLSDTLRIGRRAMRALIGKDLFPRRDRRLASVSLGSGSGSWTIAPGGLSSQSIVYSFGVGTDISFDLALIERFGVTVHAFDPTPRSQVWLARQNLPDRFVFHSEGVAVHDGMATFHAPVEEAFVSYSMVDERASDVVVEAPVRRLSTIMRTLGHDRIDLLKMDIEGAEYDVIDDFLAARLPITQILIEFHHRFGGVGLQPTKRALEALRAHGYALFAVSAKGEEFSFIRKG